MRFLPFENIVYKTELDYETVLKKLDNIIEAQKTFRMKGIFRKQKNKPYEGSIHGNKFEIKRIINYRNSFLPRISGIIEEGINETKISVKMRLHPFVMIFLFIWFGGIGQFFFTFLINSTSNENSNAFFFIPLGMLVFGYALVTGGFKYESMKSKQDLAFFLMAEIEK